MNRTVEGGGGASVLPLAVTDYSATHHEQQQQQRSPSDYTSTPSPIGTPIPINTPSSLQQQLQQQQQQQKQQQEGCRVVGNISSLQPSIHTMAGK